MNPLARFLKLVIVAMVVICLNHSHAAGQERSSTRTKARGHQRITVSLAGQWQCKLDSNNRGLSEKWQDLEITSSMVTLPGTTQTNEIGPEPPKKLINNLTPTTEYLGAAWYQREIEFSKAPADRLPNFVVIFCDDLGYGDVNWLGAVENRTPHISTMAREGVCFTDFYCTSGVCSPSRASLMTGCYPMRVGMHKSSRGMFVLVPEDLKGLNPAEKTIAEVLKPRGYTTACIGKWHLGDQPEFLPTQQGFDYYYGVPYSNDMAISRNLKLAKDIKLREGVTLENIWQKKRSTVPLMRGDEVIEYPADQNTLTKRYTAEVVKFIRANRDNPFFVYLPHTMPHVPIRVSEQFKGKSSNGPYGDAVEEIDWSTGQILAAIKELGIDRRTLVIFTSDNGATRRGSNKPFSGGKARYFEGSMRMPCVMWWPGTITAGSKCGELTTTMDLLPTFADFAGAQVPEDRIIDGRSIRPLVEGQPGAQSPHEAFYYYYMSQLSAVRSGKWKLWLALDPQLQTWMGKCEAALYDLQADPGEKVNLKDKYPDVVKRLERLAQKARADIGDYKAQGTGQRTAGLVENNQL